jgi:hypothetical protein
MIITCDIGRYLVYFQTVKDGKLRNEHRIFQDVPPNLKAECSAVCLLSCDVN